MTAEYPTTPDNNPTPPEPSNLAAMWPDVDPDAVNPPIDANLLETQTQVAREGLQGDAARITAIIRRKREPNYGYWSAWGGSHEKEDRQILRDMRSTAETEARAKTPEQRTAFDTYILVTSNDVPEDIAATGQKNPVTGELYFQIDKQIAEDLANGQLPRGFEDPVVLEQMTDYLINRGLWFVSDNPSHASPDLERAATILRDATLLVPNFNPAKAGVLRLYKRMAYNQGVLKAESPHWKFNRAGRTMGDPVGSTTGHCSLAVQETLAAVMIQGRFNLITDEQAQS